MSDIAIGLGHPEIEVQYFSVDKAMEEMKFSGSEKIFVVPASSFDAGPDKYGYYQGEPASIGPRELDAYMVEIDLSSDFDADGWAAEVVSNLDLRSVKAPEPSI